MFSDNALSHNTLYSFLNSLLLTTGLDKMSKMIAPQTILDLVDRFQMHKDAYKAASYNETQVRREFVDPFFKALGWDIDNEQGYAEAYKDVVHEDALKIGGATKAPDYAFRIGGTRKFFLEAKRPSVNIKDDISPAYQLRRYAWSAKLPLSILTDFEEFAVYDCRVKPTKGDNASIARVAYFTFEQYHDKWDEISSVFSRESILKGSFDKYADDNTRKRGTAEVDDSFLEEIEGWRAALARNIALRNPELTVRELNAAVQRTIDRIIFLRIAEDRGIEKYGQLHALQFKKGLYSALSALLRTADNRYNSGLFHFKKGDGPDETLDNFTLDLTIDDKTLKPIISSLYYPESPYAFSVLPADILGQVYERFLGKVIRLSGSRAFIEEKPEVKKAGGVYYTPTYVVRYIVRQTLGPLLDGKTPAQASGQDRRVKDPTPIRVLDPACGSGSFLIEAYQFLLDWYRDQYVADGPDKFLKGHSPTLLQATKGDWRLTIAERRRILLTHIFGVDIDPQAVEVTKLSLLLKVLEGESADAMARQMDFFNICALPDLGLNIRCGNSLVESDFYRQHEMSIFSDDQLFRINAFDWKDEFSFFQNSGGFDVVIGNPPYGATIIAEEKEYFKSKYEHQSYQYDSYLLFIERSINKLLVDNGIFGMIVPNPWLTNLNQAVLRSFVVSRTCLKDVVHFRFPVFSRAKAIVDTEIVIFENKAPKENIFHAKIVDELSARSEIEGAYRVIEHRQADWSALADEVFNIFLDKERASLAKKIRSCGTSSDNFISWNVGMKPYQSGKGVPKQTREDVKGRVFDAKHRVNAQYRQYIRGADFEKFIVRPIEERWIKYGKWLAEPRPGAQFENPVKILVRQTGDSLISAIDRNQMICMNNVHVGIVHAEDVEAEYIVGLLNSTLLDWTYHSLNPEMGEALAEVKKENVARLPIVAPKKENETQISEIVSCVKNIESIKNNIMNVKIESDRTQMVRRLDSVKRRLDELVFRLYELTVEEQKIIVNDEEMHNKRRGSRKVT